MNEDIISVEQITEIINEVKKKANKCEPCIKPKCLVKAFKLAPDRMIQKLGEEASEVIIDSVKHVQNGNNREALVAECADLLYRFLILLNYFEIDFRELTKEINKRFNSDSYCNCHKK